MVEGLEAILTSSSKIPSSNSRPTSPPSPFPLLPSQTFNQHSATRGFNFNLRIRCEAAAAAAAGSAVTEGETTKKQRKRSVFEIENLTTWLLKREQAGDIDAELTIVLSSISLACKQIASLLQRSSIINLTGAQGTINVQGEDQKKLDVISNEVSSLVTVLNQ